MQEYGAWFKMVLDRLTKSTATVPKDMELTIGWFQEKPTVLVNNEL
jgi:hypothetical protein